MSPLQLVLAKLTDARLVGDRYSARCPAHDDESPSLSIREGNGESVLLKCFAGCAVEDIVGALGLQMRDLFKRRSRSSRSASTPSSSADHGLTIEALAEAKGLPADYLRQQLGWHEIEYARATAVAIPYVLRNGSVGRTRVRKALDGARFAWQKSDAPIVAYEPDRGSAARAQKWLLVVEGETDSAVCALHGYPVLGIPGASYVKLIEPDLELPRFSGQIRLLGSA